MKRDIFKIKICEIQIYWYLLVNWGPKSVSRFQIPHWNVTKQNWTEHFHFLQLTVHIENKFVSIFMVTYLPTILINIINQLANHIPGDSKYDLLYTINITSMMVLASISLSVSASLPTTSSIKPIEVWLIFNLVYPFLVILANIFMQV